MTATRYDLVVIGSGLIGRLTTILAARLGFSALLLEQDSEQDSPDSKTGFVDHEALRILKHLKFWKCIEPIFEIANQQKQISLQAQLYSFDRANLSDTLSQELQKQSSVSVIAEAVIQSIGSGLEFDQIKIFHQGRQKMLESRYLLICKDSDHSLSASLNLKFIQHGKEAKILKHWHYDSVVFLTEAAYSLPQSLQIMALSTAIKDAYSLVWKLDLMWGKIVDPRLANFHKGERSSDVEDLFAIASPKSTAFLEKLLPKKWQPKKPDLRTEVRYGIVGQHSPLRGRFFEHIDLTQTTGKQIGIDRALGESFVILGMNKNPVDALSPTLIEYLAKIRTQFFKIIPKNQPFLTETRFTSLLYDHHGHFAKWMKGAGLNFVILRPDRIVYDAVLDAAELNNSLGLLMRKMPLLGANKK